MIRIRIQFNNSLPVDTYDEYGFIYLSSDHRFSAPLKELESTAYPEESGVHYYDKAVFDKFDYKVTFLVEGSTPEDVNDRIENFNSALATNGTLNKVTIYNDYKKVKIVGYGMPIDMATDFWRDSKGNVAEAAKVEFTVKVGDPTQCDFNFVPFIPHPPIRPILTTEQNDNNESENA